MSADESIVHFESFRFDLETAKLFERGRAVRLHPQPAKVLRLLTQRAGELVTREDLRRELWDDDTHVDFDLGINSAIRQLRAALGEDAEHPRFIETVTKQGYVFVAPITRGPRSAPVHDARDVRREPRRAVAAILAVAVGIAAWLAWRGASSRGPDEATPSSVVHTRRVTDVAGEKAYPSLSPDGEWLVFASRASGNWDIYLQDIRGGNPVNLTRDFAGVDDQPVFSPDGSRIAFYSERDGGGLFVMGRTGDSVRRVVATPPNVMGAFGFNPAWSPDGRAIAFTTADDHSAMNRGIVYSELWVVDVTTGESRRLKAENAFQPHWSPNGERIAFWSKTEGNEHGEIWTIPSEGGTPVGATSDPAHDWNPVWSPNGRYLYFLSARGGSPNLWRIRVDETSGSVEGPPEAVTRGEATSRNHVAISSDGSRLAYVVASSSQNLQQVAFDPVAEKVVGEPEWLTRGSVHRAWPMPSPDGKWLAYVQDEEDGNWLFVSRRDGSAPVRLVEGFLHAWSPDSESIAFASTRGGSRDIWKIHRDGTGLAPLTSSPDAALSSPVWSPDGARIAGLDITRHEAFFLRPDAAPGASRRVALPPANDRGNHLVVRSWSRDGRFLLGGWPFDHGAIGIGVYDIEMARYETVVDFHARSSQFLSDGRRFVFLSMGPEVGAETNMAPAKLFVGDRLTGSYHEILDVSPDAIATGLGVSSDDRWIFFAREQREDDIWVLDTRVETEATNHE